MKLGIVGSRTFNDYGILNKILKNYFILWDISLIVSGGAEGADTLAEQFAKENEIDSLTLRPKWKIKGKSAGFIRNDKIWENSDTVIAFWDGKSSGTKHSFELAKKHNKDFLVVEYNSKKIYYAHRKEEQ
jgi:hypothetical protein